MKTTKFAAAVVAGLLIASVTACSGDNDSSSEKDPSSDKTPVASDSVDPAKVSPSDLPEPPEVKNGRGAISALTLGECEKEAGKQSVSGEITSSAKATADYLVTVSWTTAASDVMGRGFKVLRDVAPGDTVEFTINAEVADGATECVPGVMFGNIG